MAVVNGQWQSDERLYLNSKGEVVAGDDADRQSLLVAQGAAIPMELAQKHGLNAKAEEPSSNKAIQPASNKSEQGDPSAMRQKALQAMNKDALVAEAEKLGLPTEGTKAELLTAIAEKEKADVTPPEDNNGENGDGA